jgi:hypothetical protein
MSGVVAAALQGSMPGECFTRREPLAKYLACADYISSSALRRFQRHGMTPELATVSQPPPRGASLGDALHAMLLEPDRFEENFVQAAPGTPVARLRGPEELFERAWLSARECEALRAMARGVRECTRPRISGWLEHGAKEVSLDGSDAGGGRWKGRPDCFTEEVILELKTASDIRPQRFARARERFGYDLQAALYLEGVERLTGTRPRFLYVVVESVRPHAVWVQEPSPEELARARLSLQAVRARFLAALGAGA